jgi:hypothetical protein
MSGENLFEQAQLLQVSGKYAEAEPIYDQLLTQNHDNPGLLATLGTLYLQMDKLGLAISLLERAVSKNPCGDVFCNLGIAYKQSGQYEKCKEAFKRAMKFNPSAETMANYAALFVNVGTPDEAVKHAKKALKADPNCPMAHWNLGIAELELGNWESGWEHHEWGYKTMPPMRIHRGRELPEWDGSPGKVWVYGEQGIGDEIMFASMIPDLLKTNEVVFECHQRLQTLFKKSFGIECIGTREEKETPWVKDHNPQWRISVASLGKFFRKNRESFPGTPYLKAEPLETPKKYRVGISWTGGLKPGRIATRAVPLPWWDSILANDCEFVSLQYTDCEADLQAVEKKGFSIKTYPEVTAHDYYETARLVKSCDLVISVCTSVIHLAGALGVPCWVMTPNKPAWRYGVSGGMPWYRSVRLYRQKDDWMPVIERIGFDLSEILYSLNRKQA